MRSVCGMINNCGILDMPYVEGEDPAATLKRHQMCENVYRIYRNADELYKPGSDFSTAFRKEKSHQTKGPPIRFLGILDTVGALGVPKVRFATTITNSLLLQYTSLCSSIHALFPLGAASVRMQLLAGFFGGVESQVSLYLGVQVMRVFFFVSIVKIIGAPQSGPPRPLAAALYLPTLLADR